MTKGQPFFVEAELTDLLNALNTMVPELLDRRSEPAFTAAFDIQALRIVSGTDQADYPWVKSTIDAILEDHGCKGPWVDPTVKYLHPPTGGMP